MNSYNIARAAFIVSTILLAAALLALSACAPQPEVRVVTGAKGDPGLVGPPGERGSDGTSVTGPAGTNGSSCTVTQTLNGSLISCEDGSSAVVNNGAAGPAGQDFIAEVIDPCGNAPGIVDEVILKTSDSRYLVFFTANIHGDYGRLALLPPGSYMTTDGQDCHFTIDADGVYHE